MKNRTSDSPYNFSEVWEKINEIDERVKKLEKLEKHTLKIKQNRGSTIPHSRTIESLEVKLQGKVDKIGPQGLIILALYNKPKQSKLDLHNTLLGYGVKKTIHGWFKGSNFKWRLLDSGIIMKNGTNSNNEDLFSLTITKGIPKAEELVEKYELS